MVQFQSCIYIAYANWYTERCNHHGWQTNIMAISSPVFLPSLYRLVLAYTIIDLLLAAIDLSLLFLFHNNEDELDFTIDYDYTID